MANQFTLFTNGRYCLDGELVEDHLVVSEETGLILPRTGYIGGEIVDLEDNIVAPGFLELHTNGVNGFSFAQFDDDLLEYARKMRDAAEYYVTQGVTGFWPTVTFNHHPSDLVTRLPPCDFPFAATMRGAHSEGPRQYWVPPDSFDSDSHDSNSQAIDPPANFCDSPLTDFVGTILKLHGVSPKSHVRPAIHSFKNANVVVSLEDVPTTTYAEALAALDAGATCLTQTSGPERSKSAVGRLVDLPEARAPYYTMIADGHHLDAATIARLYRANPRRAILVSDSIELAGDAIPPGVYPGNALTKGNQVKLMVPGIEAPKVVAEGTDKVVGGAGTLAQSVRNLMKVTGCSVAEAVRCVTENVAGLMRLDGFGGVGVLKEGRRADLCVLNDKGEVLQTWVAGKMVWEREGGLLGSQ